MITYIKGIITFIQNDIIIIENNNIGYLVYCNYKYTINSNVRLYIYHFKNDYLDEYYGFNKYENLQLFKDLMNIKGIGCKFSFSISSNNACEVKNAIMNKDIEYLSSIPKIGIKMAERIINNYKATRKINKDLIDTLIQLGYSKKDIYLIIDKIDENISIEEQIKLSLSLIKERR